MRLSKRQDPLERELRRHRAEPSDEFLDRLVARMSVGHRSPARSLRIAFAGALTLALLVAFAAFGGVGYAAAAVSQAIQAVKVSPTPPTPAPVYTKNAPANNVSSNSASTGNSAHADEQGNGVGEHGKPDEDQYKPGCGNGDDNHDHTGPPGKHNGFPGPCPPGPGH